MYRRLFFYVAAAGLAAHALHTGLGLGGEGLDPFFNDYLFNALIVAAAAACIARAWLGGADLHRSERPAWLLFGLGIASWGVGEIHYSLYLAGDPTPPFPTIGDAFYLGFFPLCYAGLVLLVRARVRHFYPSLWLDGAIGALAVAALGAALVFQPIVDDTQGSVATVAVNLAYPLADLLLLAFVVTSFAFLGWRPEARLLLLGAGFAASAVADTYYLYEVAEGTYKEGTILDSFWPAGSLLIAYAAWRPSPRTRRVRIEGWRMLMAPTVFALAALGIHVYEDLEPVHTLATSLATAALLITLVRLALTYGESLGLLEVSRAQALTDPLTGLGNRRQLLEDLGDRLGGERPDPEPALLIALELDGFKDYNELYGHPVGDRLLARLGRNLAGAVAPYGEAYRLGGDRFCVLAGLAGAEAEPIAATAAAALADHGDGFRISSFHGMVALPQEAAEAGCALRIADHRLFQAKRSRPPAAEQARDDLAAELSEIETEPYAPRRGVTELAAAIGRRFDLPAEEMEALVQAAELHDIGKMAIPDALLRKPWRLDDEEWDYLRQHPVIGERILSTGPALMPVARRIRSTHERWDGGGYPDGLAGETIPLGSRIVAVCDAFHAMIAERPYRRARTTEQALAELRRCAGSQFDPRVVEAFAEALAGNGNRPADLRPADAQPV